MTCGAGKGMGTKEKGNVLAQLEAKYYTLSRAGEKKHCFQEGKEVI